MTIELLSNLPHVQIHWAANPRLLYINTIYSHKGINNRLTSINEKRICIISGDDLDRHPGFDANAVELGPRLGRDSKSRHSF